MRKIKLPRKRKKEFMKQLGRAAYHQWRAKELAYYNFFPEEFMDTAKMMKRVGEAIKQAGVDMAKGLKEIRLPSGRIDKNFTT